MDHERSGFRHGEAFPYRSELICHIHKGPLAPPLKQEFTRVQPPAPPGWSRRRRLMVGLLFGSVALTSIGGCIKALQGSSLLGMLPTPPRKRPADPRRVLELPLELNHFTWSPDSSHLIGYQDPTLLFLLNGKTGQKEWELPIPFRPKEIAAFRTICWSPERRYFGAVGNTGTTGDDWRAVVWNLDTKQPIWTSPSLGQTSDDLSPYAFSPNGAYFALCLKSALDHMIQIWDIRKNRLLRIWHIQPSPLFPGQALSGDGIDKIAWSWENTHLALGYQGGAIQMWDARSASLMWMTNDPNHADSWFPRSPDGTPLGFGPTLALLTGSGAYNTVHVLDASTGKQRVSIDAYGASLACSSDGMRLALGLRDGNETVVQVWDVRVGQRLFMCQSVHSELIGDLSWSPDGCYLAGSVFSSSSGYTDEAIGANSTLQFWGARSGKALFSYDAPRCPQQLTWSPDSRFLATYNPQEYVRVGIRGSYEHFVLQVFQVAGS